MMKTSILLTLMIAIGTSEAVAATSAQDTNFAIQAAQGGITEVKLAALAMRKSKNPTVLSFAQRMKTDHTKNNAQLAAIVKLEGSMPPSDVGAANRAVMGRLQGLNGAAFDRAYLAGQVSAHKKMLVLVKAEASSGSNDKLVAFAKQTAPVVQQHLGMASMDARMVASTST
jgi:putative membrane protein